MYKVSPVLQRQVDVLDRCLLIRSLLLGMDTSYPFHESIFFHDEIWDIIMVSRFGERNGEQTRIIISVSVVCYLLLFYFEIVFGKEAPETSTSTGWCSDFHKTVKCTDVDKDCKHVVQEVYRIQTKGMEIPNH